MKGPRLLVSACVELVIAYKRWKGTVSGPIDGWWRACRKLQWAVVIGWKFVRDFVVELPLVPSPLRLLHMSEP